MSHHSNSRNKKRKLGSQSKSVISDPDGKAKDCGLIDISPGDVIRGRYAVIRKCGQGTFGTVLCCYDKQKREKVAIKAIRSVRRYLKSADLEIKVLESIYDADHDDNSLCVKLKKSFSGRMKGKRHKFIVFEKLGCSLYDFLSRNNFDGFSLKHVKEFSYQLLKAIRFCHKINLIHTDLKPENILLADDSCYLVENSVHGKGYMVPRKTNIKLIDFGAATFNDEHHTRIITTRQYRAPEVLLGLGWSFPASVVCRLHHQRTVRRTTLLCYPRQR